MTAGYRMAGARLPEAGRDTGGVVELVPPGSGAVPRGPRTRANQSLDPLPGGAGDPDLRSSDRVFAPADRGANVPFSAADAELAVVDAAVDVLKLRGEPVAFEGLLGEILVGLDRTGHLRRLVRRGTGTPGERRANARAGRVRVSARPGTGSGAHPGAHRRPRRSPAHARPDARLRRQKAGGCSRLARIAGGSARRPTSSWRPSRSPIAWSGPSSASCPPPAHCPRPRSSTASRACSRAPICRTRRSCGPASESYRSIASTPDRLSTTDDLARRSKEHSWLIANLVDLGHRLGFSCWVGERQQSRRVGAYTLADYLEQRELSGPPSLGRIAARDLEDVDVVWYVRGKMAMAFEVEWTAMLSDTVLRHHARIPTDERLVRFLVVLPERVGLVRHKLDRSPLLREGLDAGGWHLVKANHVRDWAAREQVELADLEPLLGLDPAVERTGDQMSLFTG